MGKVRAPLKRTVRWLWCQVQAESDDWRPLSTAL